jgi:hypothetical protein
LPRGPRLAHLRDDEALHHAGHSPHLTRIDHATRLGVPREAAARLARAVKRVLAHGIARTIDPARCAAT